MIKRSRKIKNSLSLLFAVLLSILFLFSLSYSLEKQKVIESEAARRDERSVKGEAIVILKISNSTPSTASRFSSTFESKTIMTNAEKQKVDTFQAEMRDKGITSVSKIIEIPTKNRTVYYYMAKFNTNESVAKKIKEIKKNRLVENAFPNAIIPGLPYSQSPNDPLYLDDYPSAVSNRDPNWNPNYDYQWNLRMAEAMGGWGYSTGSSTVDIAVIDTGVDPNHEDLQGKVVMGKNFITGDMNSNDDNGHGTHVASTAAGKTNNSKGIAGVCPECRIIAIKAIDAGGAGTLHNLIQAIVYAADNGAEVINASFGGNIDTFGSSPWFEQPISYAYNKGIVFVAAAGNDNIDAIDFSPAADTCRGMLDDGSQDCTITVAALDHTNNKASYSNFGEEIDVLAPGGGVPSDGGGDILAAKSSTLSPAFNGYVVSGKYLRLSGTSMAAPHVSGLAALIKSKNSLLTPKQIGNVIYSGMTRRGSYVGGISGAMNMKNSLKDMNSNDTVPSPTPTQTHNPVAGTKSHTYIVSKEGRVFFKDDHLAASSWNDVTNNVVTRVISPYLPFVSFSSHYDQSNALVQFAITKGSGSNKIWRRAMTSNAWSEWVDVSSNIGTVGNGKPTSFNAYVDSNGSLVQQLVRGGQIWRRTNEQSCQGWCSWEDYTLTTIPSWQTDVLGTIISYKSYYDFEWGEIDHEIVTEEGDLYVYNHTSNDWFWIGVGGSDQLTGNITSYSTSRTPKHCTGNENPIADLCSPNNYSCNQTCTQDSQCAATNPDWYCASQISYSGWFDESSGIGTINTVSGQISTATTSFNVITHADGSKTQHLVKGGRLYSRTKNTAGVWDALWTDDTANITQGSGTLVAFNSFYNQAGKVVQTYIKGNNIWSRTDLVGNFIDNTALVTPPNSSGNITGYSAYIHSDNYIVQRVIRGGKSYVRNNITGSFNSWQEETSLVDCVGTGANNCGTGTLLSIEVDKHEGGAIKSHILREGNKLYRLDFTTSSEVCRSRTNQYSNVCSW